MTTHQDWVEELADQLASHPNVPVVVLDDDRRSYEIEDVAFRNVDGEDQITVRIVREY